MKLAGLALALAARNLARRPARTALTVGGLATGLTALVLLWGFNSGLHRNMQGNLQDAIIGSLQIHHAGFFAQPTLERHIADPARVIARLEAHGLEHWTRRLESFALAAGPERSSGVLLMGVDPVREPRVTRLPERVTIGRFLAPEDEGVCILGAGAAAALGVRLGEPVTLVANDRYGMTVAEACTLIGVLTSGETGIDQGLLLLPLGDAQHLLEMQGAVTSIPVRVAPERLSATAALLAGELEPGGLEVMPWYEMFPVMQEWIRLHDAFMTVFTGIVLAIVLASILNTVLLSVTERTVELGMLMAVGTPRHLVAATVLLETTVVAVAGTALGVAGGLVLVQLTAVAGVDLSLLLGDTTRFYVDPVVRPRLEAAELGVTALGAFVAAVLAGVYPALRAARLDPARAFRDA